MISEEEIKHLAKLSHLYLDKKQIKKYQKELSEILDYVSKLQVVEKTDISEIDSENFANFRPDETWQEKICSAEELLASVPARQKNFIKTKGVFAQSKKTIKKSTKI